MIHDFNDTRIRSARGKKGFTSMRTIIIYTLFCALATIPVSFCASQNVKNKNSAEIKLISALPKNISEASGLELDSDNNLWTHNDGGIPALYCIGKDGQSKRVIHINGVNSGWEDLTQDRLGNFYIGAFGNNANTKSNFKIYKIPNPALIKEDVVNPKIISYTYSDFNSHKNFDVDAFISFNDSLYLFTKRPSAQGYIRVYRLPSNEGTYEASLMDSIKVGANRSMESWVTSACLSPDKKVLALLFHDKIMLIKQFNKTQFSSGRITKVELNNFTHKAGMCFYEPKKVYVVDEMEFFLGGNLYAIDLGGALGE